MYEGLVLSAIVGGLVVDLKNVLELLAFQGYKQDPAPAP